MELNEKTRLLMEKALKKAGIEPDAIDLLAFWDSHLNYQENKKSILKQLGKEAKEVDVKGLEEKAIREEKERAEEYAEQQFNKAITRITKNANPEVSKYYKNAERFIEMVAKGYASSLILESEGGLGKSHLVLRKLKELGIEFEYRCGKITPLKLHEEVYRNNGKVFFFDDAKLLFENREIVNWFLPILWEVSGNRTAEYISSSEKLVVPEKFKVESTFIFALNDFPEYNPTLEALKNRTLYYRIFFSFPEKIQLFYEVAKQEYKGLSKQERFAIVNWIKETANETHDNLSIRTLIKCFDIYCYDKECWKEMATDLLKPNPCLSFIKQNECETASKQLELFKKEFGLSKSSFYRYKKELKKRQGVLFYV